jgi:hypothetical protein
MRCTEGSSGPTQRHLRSYAKVLKVLSPSAEAVGRRAAMPFAEHPPRSSGS